MFNLSYAIPLFRFRAHRDWDWTRAKADGGKGDTPLAEALCARYRTYAVGPFSGFPGFGGTRTALLNKQAVAERLKRGQGTCEQRAVPYGRFGAELHPIAGRSGGFSEGEPVTAMPPWFRLGRLAIPCTVGP